MKLSDKKFTNKVASEPTKVPTYKLASVVSETDQLIYKIAQMIGQLPDAAVAKMVNELKSSGMSDIDIVDRVKSTGMAGDLDLNQTTSKVIDMIHGGPDNAAGMAANPGNFHRDTLSQPEIDGTGKIGQKMSPPGGPPPAPPEGAPPAGPPPQDQPEMAAPEPEMSPTDTIDVVVQQLSDLKEQLDPEGAALDNIGENTGFTPNPLERKIAGPLDEYDDVYTTNKSLLSLPDSRRRELMLDFYNHGYMKPVYSPTDVERIESQFGIPVEVGTPMAYEHLSLAQKKRVDDSFNKEMSPFDIERLLLEDQLNRQESIKKRRQEEQRLRSVPVRKVEPGPQLDDTPTPLADTVQEKRRTTQDIDKALSEAQEKSKRTQGPFGEEKKLRNPIKEKSDLERKLKIDKIQKTFQPTPIVEQRREIDKRQLSPEDVMRNIAPIVENLKKNPDLTPSEIKRIRDNLIRSWSSQFEEKKDVDYIKVGPDSYRHEFYDTDDGLAAALALAQEFAKDPATGYGQTIRIIETLRDENDNPVPATKKVRKPDGSVVEEPLRDDNGNLIYRRKIVQDEPSKAEQIQEHKQYLEKLKDPQFKAKEEWRKRMQSGGLQAIKPPQTVNDLPATFESLSPWPSAQAKFKDYFGNANAIEPGPGFKINPSLLPIVTNHIKTPKFRAFFESVKETAKKDSAQQREKLKQQDEKYQRFNIQKQPSQPVKSLSHIPGPVQNIQSPVMKQREIDRIRKELQERGLKAPTVQEVMNMPKELRTQYLTKDEQKKLQTIPDETRAEIAKKQEALSKLNSEIDALYNKYKREHREQDEKLHDYPQLKNDPEEMSRLHETINKAMLVDSLNKDPSQDIPPALTEFVELKNKILERNKIRDDMMKLRNRREDLAQTFETRMRERQFGNPLTSETEVSPQVMERIVDIKNRLPKLKSVLKDLDVELMFDPSLSNDISFMNHYKAEQEAFGAAKDELTKSLKGVKPPKTLSEYMSETAGERARLDEAAMPEVQPEDPMFLDGETLEARLQERSQQARKNISQLRVDQMGEARAREYENAVRNALEAAKKEAGPAADVDDIVALLGSKDENTEIVVGLMKKLDYLRNNLDKNMDDRMPLGTHNYKNTPLVQAAVARYGNEWASKNIKMQKGTPSYSRKKYLADTGKMDALLPLDIVLKMDDYRKANNLPRLVDGLAGLSADDLDMAYEIIRGYLVETNKIMTSIMRSKSEEAERNRKKGSLAIDEAVVLDAISTVESLYGAKIDHTKTAALIDFMSSSDDEGLSDEDLRIAALLDDNKTVKLAAIAVVDYINSFNDKYVDILPYGRRLVYKSAISKSDELSRVAAKFKVPSVKGSPSDAVKIDALKDKADLDEFDLQARPAHLKFEIANSGKTGSYAIVDLTWDPSDDAVCGMSQQAVEQAIRSFMKGQESNKNFIDWGFTGKIVIDDLDLEAGTATIHFATDKGADAPLLTQTV